MKGTQKIINLGIGLVTAVASSSALAQTNEPPRGPDVDRIAANCNIGPFQQTGKAGPYNALCTSMSDGEKCLALIKDNMSEEGEINRTADVERATYCLEVFRQELLVLSRGE